MTAAPVTASSRTFRSLLALLALLPLAAACERAGGLAPLTMGQQASPSAGGTVTVQPGDTAYSLSRRYSVPLRDLIEVNGLQAPYMLAIGQRLTLPVSRQYIVQKGDTLYGISRMFSVDTSELTRLNNLTPPYGVQAGQPLRLPGESGAMETAGRPPAPVAAVPVAPAPSGVPASPTPSGRPGAIETAELPPPGASAPSAPSTGTGAAAPAGIAVTPLPAPVPGARPPAGADSGGASLYEQGQAPTVLRPPSAKPEPAPIPAPAPAPVPAPVARPAPAEAAPPVREVVVAPPPKAEEPPPRSSGRFMWPVKGKLVSGYGPKPDGMHNDGLNIVAPKGTTVVAADNGVVAYAGNELRGFGNLLLIRHADGWITAYAHLDRIDVERGATVKRGQAIATVGQTGSVTSPQLHFELRKGTQAVDPRDQMAPARLSEAVSPDGRQGPG